MGKTVAPKRAEATLPLGAAKPLWYGALMHGMGVLLLAGIILGVISFFDSSAERRK